MVAAGHAHSPGRVARALRGVWGEAERRRHEFCILDGCILLVLRLWAMLTGHQRTQVDSD